MIVEKKSHNISVLNFYILLSPIKSHIQQQKKITNSNNKQTKNETNPLIIIKYAFKKKYLNIK